MKSFLASKKRRTNTTPREAAAIDTVKRLRKKVVQADRQRDERDDLIGALDEDREAKDEKIDLLQAALDAAIAEIEAGQTIEAALNTALVASEKRADKLEEHVMKDRRKKIAIGVGSAVGGIAITFGATYAATRL